MPILSWQPIIKIQGREHGHMFKSELLPGQTAYLMSNDYHNTYFSEPSGMAAFIFEAEADEHPPPPVPTRVALLGSILSTEATALSICEGILEKDLIACFVTEANMREVKELQAISDELRWKIPLRQV
jgi:hypothetical protein